ncbi:MAG: DNA-binding response regulator [Proteobacteria bacterium]|nr:DNA-binding response regulator [Pseudomonadota bacterium]
MNPVNGENTGMSGNHTALVFEEDSELCGLYADALRAAGYRVVLSKGPASAIRQIMDQSPVLILFNSRLSERDASQSIKDIGALLSAEGSRNPLSCPSVLILADQMDSPHFESWRSPGVRVEILVRPFTYGAFIAKVQAFLPPRPGAGGGIPGLSLNPVSQDVRLNGERLHLTGSEFRLLSELLARPGVALSRDELVRKVLGEGVVVVDRAIDTHVFSLRKKLGPVGSLIETVRGEGYRLRLANADTSQE